MIGLPDDEQVGALIRWLCDSHRYRVAVCHGPAALMAAAKTGHERHPHARYELCASLDRWERQPPAIGDLPGPLAWFQGERLEAQGKREISSETDGATQVGCMLYSGDSPKACDQLEKMITVAWLEEFAN